MTYTFDFYVIRDNWQFLVSGAFITILVTVVSLAFGTVIGLVVGIMRLSRSRLLSGVAWTYIEVLRNTPVLVQLIWVYYCIPVLTGLRLDAQSSCILALSLSSGAYIGEIVRGGISGIDRGQTEAARTIGLSSFQTMRMIVLPQALHRMIAPLVNETVTLFKYSSLVSVLGVADLTYNAQVLATSTFRPIEIFTFVGLEYLVLCASLSYTASVVERRLAARY